MERSGNFYKAIRLGYILISILIGCMAYNSLYEWQEIEALELGNKKIDELRKEINNINIQMIKFSLLGETILEWNDKDIEHYHARRMAMDSMLCRFKATYPAERIDSVRSLLEDKERQMFQIVRLMDEQQSINKKIANQIPVIVQKSVQEQSKKPKRKGFLGIFGKKKEVTPAVSTTILHSVNRNVISEQKVQDLLSAKGRNKIKFDDYMQYSPMVAVYGLNLAGVKGKHSFKGRTIILAMSYATMGMIVNTMKYSFKEKRPDSNTRNSFPSGHTATAFMGAEFLYREYRDVSPWIGYAGYAIAAITGYLRIYNDRHYLNDVVAGACIGVLSTKLAYWLYPKIFKKSECYKEHVAIVTLPYYSAKEVGLNMCICF